MTLTNEEYVKRKGFVCPVCDDRLIEADIPKRTKDGGLICIVKCHSCKSEWHDIYSLASFEMVDEPNPAQVAVAEMARIAEEGKKCS